MPDPKSINDLNADLFHPDEPDRFSDPKEIRKKAMDFLARREYAFGELVRKLTGGGYDQDIAESEIRRLAEEGLQSDSRFAESFVQSRINQGKGPVRIRLELEERGLAAAAIDTAIDETGENWLALACAVRQRKFGAEFPADFEEKARQMRFLQYRGFESAEVQGAMRPHGEDPL